MPKLSIHHANPTASNPSADYGYTHIPFTAHVRVVSTITTGKRMEIVRDLEKKALRVELDLVDAGFNIATPVAMTPQFGDYSARLTIVGFIKKPWDRLNQQPTTDIQVIHSGTDEGNKTAVFDVNRGGSLSEGQNTTNLVNQEVSDLRTALGISSQWFSIDDILYIEYNGVKFGYKKIGGRSFPG